MNDTLAFTLIAFLLVVSPGPNSILILKTASAYGRRASLLNILGLTSATFFHGLFSIFGISALLLQSAELFMIIKFLGAGYLFYIGAKAIFQTLKKGDPVNSIKKQARGGNSSSKQRSMSFFNEGFITQILNPKVSMFYLAAFPQFTNPESFSLFSSFSLVFIHALIIATWFTCVTFTIERFKSFSNESALGVWVQRVSGSVMIYFSSLIVTHKS